MDRSRFSLVCLIVVFSVIVVRSETELSTIDTGRASTLLDLPPRPSLSEPIPNVTVSAGRDVSLPCVVENLGGYRVAWFHKEKNRLISIQTRVVLSQYRVKYSVTHLNYRIWYLHLSRVDASDSGHYVCQVNTTPMISQTGHLEVVVAPSIVEEETSSDVHIREGSDAKMTCTADGSPKPSIKWRREDDSDISVDGDKVAEVSGPSLKLSKVSRLSMVAYLCVASNGIPPSVSKRIMLNVNFPPMIWIPNQLVGVAAGDEVSLDCHLEAFPEPVTYWTRGESQAAVVSGEDRDSVVMRSGMYKVQMRLRFRSVTSQDYGAYKCVAKNSLGDTEGKIRLYEISQTTTHIKVHEENFDIAPGKTFEYETLPPVSANNMNSEGFNTVWKNPTQKGSIESGGDGRNGARPSPQSFVLQIALCALLHVADGRLGRRLP